MDFFNNFLFKANFIITIHTITCHLVAFSNMQLNTTLGTLYNIDKFE